MATITLKGNPVETSGDIAKKGDTAPAFTLTNTDLSDLTLASLSGKRVILNIFPSVDTPTCATSVRTFNEQAATLENTAVVCVSADLPFAGGRFCGAEGIENVSVASSFRSTFGSDYQLNITTGPLSGLLARAVIVLDENQNVLHSELVSEIADEPNYQAAMDALK